MKISHLSTGSDISPVLPLKTTHFSSERCPLGFKNTSYFFIPFNFSADFIKRTSEILSDQQHTLATTVQNMNNPLKGSIILNYKHHVLVQKHHVLLQGTVLMGSPGAAYSPNKSDLLSCLWKCQMSGVFFPLMFWSPRCKKDAETLESICRKEQQR